MSARLRRAALAALLLVPGALAAQSRVGDLTLKAGDVPRRLVGYGLVLGLDGTGDRSFGGFQGETPTVRSIVNLLRRFDIQVPAQLLVARNVAAVMVTAEVSPYLRAGGRFEVQVASMGDALSLKGGVLFMTPLQSDPGAPPVATAQGPVLVRGEERQAGGFARRGTAATIPEGGILEVDPTDLAPATPVLRLRRPDLGVATRVAAAINAAYGDSTARVQDPGSIGLRPPAGAADNLLGLLAAIDTLPVAVQGPARVVISARDGSVVAGGDVRVGPAAVSHRGITLSIGGTEDAAPTAPAAGGAKDGAVRIASGATVQDVAAGLHAAGAASSEMAAIFNALAEVGALQAQVVVR